MITTPPDGYADAAHDLDAEQDARLVRVCGHHASSAEALADVRRVRKAGGMLCGGYLTDESAKAIASWWQGPGRVGSTLAAFASGAAFNPDDLLADVHATMAEQGFGKAKLRTGVERSNVLQLDALASYVVGVLGGGK